jgi:rhamnosyl/mannosyltransferase
MTNKAFFPPFGGVETVVRSLATGLASRRDLQVNVVVPNRAGFLQRRSGDFTGAEIVEVATLATVANTPIAPTLMWQIRKTRPDLVHYHFPYPWAEAMEAVMGSGRPYIVSYHADIGRFKTLFRLYRPLMTRFLRNAKRIVVATPSHISSSPFLSTLPDEMFEVIPFGLDLDPYRESAELTTKAGEFRMRLAGNGPCILFAGRLVNYKGIPTLLKAMQSIPGTLVMVGEGPLRGELQGMAEELRVSDRIRWEGFVKAEDLPAYHRAADVFVLPSDRPEEAFGLVQVEAHASGRPVVCCALPTGVTEVNLNGKTGMVVPLRDHVAMAKAINDLLINPTLRSELGNRARDRAYREFTIEIMCDRYQNLYREILEKPCIPL